MWAKFNDNAKGTWLINQDGLTAFARQYVYAQLLSEKSKIVHTKQTFNILGFNVSGPELVTVETDFLGIRNLRDGRSRMLYDQITTLLRQDGKRAFSKLVDLHGQLDDFRDNLREMQQAASDETMDNVESSVTSAEKYKHYFEVIRDLSATTLVVGAGFLSGGSALAVLSSGSALKGYGKYQATGDVGQGVLEATGTFIVGTIAMAPNLTAASKSVSLLEKSLAPTDVTTGERVALILVGAQTDAALEAGKSVIEGGSGKQALEKAGLRFATDVATGGTGIKLDRMALPVVVRLVTDTGLTVGSDKVVDLAPGGQNNRPVPAGLHPVRDCHPTIHNIHLDQEYIKKVALRPA